MFSILIQSLGSPEGSCFCLMEFHGFIFLKCFTSVVGFALLDAKGQGLGSASCSQVFGSKASELLLFAIP